MSGFITIMSIRAKFTLLLFIFLSLLIISTFKTYGQINNANILVTGKTYDVENYIFLGKGVKIKLLCSDSTVVECETDSNGTFHFYNVRNNLDYILVASSNYYLRSNELFTTKGILKDTTLNIFIPIFSLSDDFFAISPPCITFKENTTELDSTSKEILNYAINTMTSSKRRIILDFYCKDINSLTIHRIEKIRNEFYNNGVEKSRVDICFITNEYPCYFDKIKTKGSFTPGNSIIIMTNGFNDY